MVIFLLVLHVLICIALVLSVIFQSSKGGALSGMVGGAANDIMGTQGASSLFKKITKVLGIAFFVVAFSLAIAIKHENSGAGKVKKSSVVDKLRKEKPVETKKSLDATDILKSDSKEETKKVQPKKEKKEEEKSKTDK